MDDLITWLLAQIAEDERGVQDGEEACVHVDLCICDGCGWYGQLNDRVLAECEAKRRMIELCRPSLIDVSPPHRPNSEFIPGLGAPWGEPVLRELGAMYAKLGRPGYQESWRSASW